LEERKISDKALTNKLNKSIGNLLEVFIKIALKDFKGAKSILNIALMQKERGKIRSSFQEEGTHVPPFIIASITKTCNLNCKGCYDKIKKHQEGEELSEVEWSKLFAEAEALGVSFILLAGGEPLTKGKVIRECINHPQIIFPIFTNGTLINEDWIEYYKDARNVIPVISIEGDSNFTDSRRGLGVSKIVNDVFVKLKKKGVFYGTSITVTSENYELVLEENYIKEYIDKGCRLFFFIEYIPFDPSTSSLVISKEQRLLFMDKINKLKKKYPGIFLAFPGDEQAFGGCLAAGRGFIHVNAIGGVEACPFAPYSDVDLKKHSLKEALDSKLLQEIRSFNESIDEDINKGGCSLFGNKDNLEKYLEEGKK
jgi:MoaA/NifB/PqqE/SkfB family radical SAM enzyme